MNRQVALVVAPSGYGKSWLVEDFAATAPVAQVRIRPRTTLCRFTQELAASLASMAPGLAQTVSLAYERCMETAEPATTLACWFAANVEDTRCIIAVDAVSASQDSRIALFVREAIERSSPSCKWLLAGRNLDDLPVATWLAREIAALPLEDRDLRIEEMEGVSIAGALGVRPKTPVVRRALAASNGAIGDFLFAARFLEDLPAADVPHDAFFERLVRRAWELLAEPQRRTVSQTAMLPQLDQAAVMSVAGGAGALDLERLRQSAPHLFESDGLHYQARFAHFLRSALPKNRLCEIAMRTARALEACGELTVALDMLASVDASDAMLAVVERHGFKCIENGQTYLLRDAVGYVDAKGEGRGAAFSCLAAYVKRQHFDLSEAHFLEALRAAQTPQERAQVRLLYGTELLRRRPTDALDVLSAVESEGVSVRVRIDATCALAAAQSAAGDAESARTSISSALRDTVSLRDATIETRVFAEAATVALELEDFATAKALASHALDAGERIGACDLVARALEVLCNVSLDGEDDAGGAARHLHAIARHAARCSNGELQARALARAYEIEAERANAPALEALAKSLDDSNVRPAVREGEALRGAQALERSWRGDFAAALRLLEVCPDEPCDDAQRARRYSHIAIYAAAAGDGARARSALRAVRRAIRTSSRAGADRDRTRLNGALAMVLCNRPLEGRRWATAIRNDLPANAQRLRAFANAIVAFADWRTHGEHHGLSLALQQLESCGCGGIARMIGALPLDCSGLMAPNRTQRRSA